MDSTLRHSQDASEHSVHDSIIVWKCDVNKVTESLKQSLKARLRVKSRIATEMIDDQV